MGQRGGSLFLVFIIVRLLTTSMDGNLRLTIEKKLIANRNTLFLFTEFLENIQTKTNLRSLHMIEKCIYAKVIYEKKLQRFIV